MALYDGFIAEYYDASPVVTGRPDLPFYLSAAREFGDPVLDLGCGTGRITLALAEAGHRATGLDISENMLERAEQKRNALPREARERLHLVEGDMTGFDLGEKFRLVIIPFRPFQHLLETRQQLECLAAVRKHLAPGGRLVLDVFHTDARRIHDPAFLEETTVAEYDMSAGRRVRLTERVTAFHRAMQQNAVEMIYNVRHADGREERLVMAWSLRYFFRYEVEHLLARAGFRVAALYGNFGRSALKDDSPEMIFTAVAG